MVVYKLFCALYSLLISHMDKRHLHGKCVVAKAQLPSQVMGFRLVEDVKTTAHSTVVSGSPKRW